MVNSTIAVTIIHFWKKIFSNIYFLYKAHRSLLVLRNTSQHSIKKKSSKKKKKKKKKKHKNAKKKKKKKKPKNYAHGTKNITKESLVYSSQLKTKR